MLKHLLSSFLMISFLLLSISVAAQNNTIDTSASSFVTRALAYLKSKEELDSTSIYLEKARQIYLQHKDFENYIFTFIETAKIFYAANYYEKGINVLNQVDKDVMVSMPSYEGQIEVTYQIARGHYFMKNYDTCINLIQRNLLKMDSVSLAFADHNNLLGVSYRSKGMNLEALNAYQKTISIRKQLLGAKHTQVASVLNNMGVAYEYLKLYNKALECYNKAFNIRVEILRKDDPTLANVLLNMGGLFDAKGEYDNAIQCYKRALAIYQANPENFEARIADIFNNLAITYKSKGSYQESTSYFQQAMHKYERLPEEQSENIANVYTNWANLVELQKNYTKAIDLQQQAINLYTKVLEPTYPSVIRAKNNLGINYYKNGEYDKALAQLQSLEPFLENNTEQRERFANVCNDLADVYYKLNNLSEAKAYNQKALTIQQDLFGNKSYRLAYTYNNLAQIAEYEDKRDSALFYLQQALIANHENFTAKDLHTVPPVEGFYKYDYYITSLLHKAHVTSLTRQESDLLEAAKLYSVADSVLLQVRNELLSAEDKIQLAEKVNELSQGAIENYIQLAQVTGNQDFMEKAFQISEENKNAVLAQSIAANQATHFAGIPDSLITLEDQLQSDIHFYKTELARQPDSLKTILYNNELFTAQVNYRDLITQLEKDFPAYYQLKYDRTLPRVRAIQEALPESTALLSYFTGDTILYSFVITKNNFEVHRSPVDKGFETKQIGLRKSIQRALNEDYVELSYDLYKTLFPFTLDNKIQSLVIISDGTLSKLPFEALLSEKVNANNIQFNKLPYLLNKYDISYALSAGFYYKKQQENDIPQQYKEGLIAYAPVFSDRTEVVFFNRDARNPFISDNDAINPAITRENKYVAPLPATKSEVEAIASLFQQKKQKVNLYLYQNANEKQLKNSDLQQSNFIHIATHGFINEQQPDLSGLLLFPDTTNQEDNVLYTGEIYNFHLQAQLVVLSACETGLGKVANGEGLLGMSRAFFYAGAQNLMVSLWKVDDQATSDLMVQFYKTYLEQAQNKFAQSLRQAKQALIRSETFSHPKYWSAFVLLGQ